jgi:putative redox protein
MGTKTASVSSVGDGLRLVGSTGSGHEVVLDNAEGDAGPRPAELIPLALAGCTAMDVVSILRKKRQEITGYDVRVAGNQEDEHPNAFTSFDVVHHVAGPDLDVEAVRRAIELSATRYCSVGATLASGSAPVEHRFVVLDTATGRETTGTVIRIGPLGAIPEPALA